jgi:membrane peptidoglycan carboxypeptidase
VAPTRFAPTADLQRSRDRAETIIALMEDQGRLTPDEAAQARANPATLSEAAQARAGGYFADWVMESTPSFLASQTTEDVLIRTTFDNRLQRAAEEALQAVFAEKVREGSKAQAAIVVMSADGAVRAMVGGRRTRVSGQFNRATQALRQTGSAFKPFIYAAALDLGYGPLDRVMDEPLTLNVPGSGAWSPQNYSRDFAGEVTLTRALADSLNIPAVKVSEAVGRDAVIAVAQGFGIATEIDDVPAMALGTSETTLLQMTAAYAGILNGGSAVAPYGMTELRLLGDDAPLIGQEGGIGERVIQRDAARQLVWMMHEVIESGTGRRAKLGDRPAAAKTGTTSAARDAWFVGFTGDYVAGVWMGYDDNTPLTGTTGGGLPADIWRETMMRVHDGLPITPLPMDAPSAAPDRVADRGPGSSTTGGQGDVNGALDRFGAAGDQAIRDTERAITNVLRSIFGG